MDKQRVVFSPKAIYLSPTVLYKELSHDVIFRGFVFVKKKKNK